MKDFTEATILNKQGVTPFAIVEGQPQMKPILFDDFKATNQQFAGNRPTLVAAWTVPTKIHAGLLPRPMRIYLMAKATFTMSGAVAAGGFACDLTTQGFKLTQSKRSGPAPATSSLAHQDVRAFHGTGGGRTQRNVSFDPNTNIVTVDRAAGVTSIDVYFLASVGEVLFRAIRPTGSDDAKPSMYSNGLRNLHEIDQTSRYTAPVMDQMRDLPPRWKVGLEVNTDAPISWVKEAGHEIVLPVALVPVKQLDISRHDAVAEIALRGGRL